MIEVRGLTKTFPGVRALQGVDLALTPGEVHGIIGENGAGKSTLMKILSGIYQPTEGSVLIEGKEVRLNGPADSIARGIGMIHQELNLVDELDVADNLFLGRERRKGLTLNRGAMREETKKYLEQVGAPFTAETPVGELSIAGKQLVEIAKAVSTDARVLIMDEPTAVLSDREAQSLFRLIRELKGRGVTIVYISHRLPEVVELCDRITVMRDGQKVTTLDAKEVSQELLAKLMVGRELQDLYPPKSPLPFEAPVLKVSGLAVPGYVERLDLELHPGEILGLAGLVGAGRTEAAEAIAGLRARRSGVIERGGQAVAMKRPQDGLRAKIAYVSEDRKGRGLVLPMSVQDNMTLANLREYGGLINRGKERTSAEEWIKRLGVKVSHPSVEVGTLSGGNQQKVAIAKWLDTKPEVLILDEPTRGVDIGAKREIYSLIHELSQQGLACLVISSEMPELIGLCHRMIVLREGKQMGELTGEGMTEENVMMLAAGVDAPKVEEKEV